MRHKFGFLLFALASLLSTSRLTSSVAAWHSATVAKEEPINRDEPATKGDLAGIRDELKQDIGDVRTGLTQEIAGVRSELKQDIADVRTELKSDIDRLETRMDSMTDEIISHFNVVAENIRKDVATANQDEISQLDDRVTRIERHLDLDN